MHIFVHNISLAIPLDDLFSPSVTSTTSHNTNANHDCLKKSSDDDHSGEDINIVDMYDTKESSVTNVQIEIVVSKRMYLKKGQRLLIDYNLDSKTITRQIMVPKIKQQRRTRQDCPYKGCSAMQLVKLSNHLRQVHGLKDPAKIKRYLKQAKLV